MLQPFEMFDMKFLVPRSSQNQILDLGDGVEPSHRITVLRNTYNVTPQVCDLFNYSLIVMIVNLYIVTSTKAQKLLRASRHVCCQSTSNRQ